MLTLISGIFGGLVRLLPEFFKYLDARNERKHELDMQEAAYKFQQLTGSQKIEEIKTQGDVNYDVSALGVLSDAIKTQGRKSGVKWVDGLNTLIRPLITIQWVILFYPAVITATFVLAIQSGTPPLEALINCFGEEEKAICAFIIDFWFVGRVLDRTRK